jgi:hypothetical protein
MKSGLSVQKPRTLFDQAQSDNAHFISQLIVHKLITNGN